MTNNMNEIYEQARSTDAFKKLYMKLLHYNFKLLNAYRFGKLVFITFEGEFEGGFYNNFKLVPPLNINDTWKVDILGCITEMNQPMLANFANRLMELNQMLIHLNGFNCKDLLDTANTSNVCL